MITSKYVMPATIAEIGMVKIQAHKRLTVIPQRTAEILFVNPTPIIAPVMVCVVETGIPKCSVKNRVMAPAVSALTPSSGVTFGSHGFHDFPTAAHGSQGDHQE